MTDESQIRAEAKRIWPDAKRFELTQADGVTLTAFNYDDRVIDSVSADSMDLLKERLEELQPEGGQAP
jgi:hypothetical protein